MKRTSRWSFVLLSFCLAALPLAAQGRPSNPGPPAAGGEVRPNVVDRDGRIVGPLSHFGSGFVVYVLPDGRKTVLSWGRTRLDGGIRPSNLLPFRHVAFRTADCSGPAYVVGFGPNSALGEHASLVLGSLDTTAPPPDVYDGSDAPEFPEIRTVYLLPPGARMQNWDNNFTSYRDVMSELCESGNPFMVWGPNVGAWKLDPVEGFDLAKAFSYPFHLSE